ncbi:MAG TPA: hypothetical protein VLX68_11370 [Chitinivibrionales bacterium]|nr:hypothetical protein [Chitinivibrionales bacterium]
MALDLPNGVSFRKNDAIEIMHNTTPFDGVVLNSGEGYMSPYEDMYYLMSAPHQGVEDLFVEENEIKSAYVLAGIDAKTIPFDALPARVEVTLKKNGKSVLMNALAVLCGRTGKEPYLVFLEAPGKKKS